MEADTAAPKNPTGKDILLAAPSTTEIARKAIVTTDARKNVQVETLIKSSDLIAFPVGPAVLFAVCLFIIGVGTSTLALWLGGVVLGLLSWGYAPVLSVHRAVDAWSTAQAARALASRRDISALTAQDVRSEAKRIKKNVLSQNGDGLTRQALLFRKATLHLPAEDASRGAALELSGMQSAQMTWTVPSELDVWEAAIDNALTLGPDKA